MIWIGGICWKMMIKAGRGFVLGGLVGLGTLLRGGCFGCFAVSLFWSAALGCWIF